MCLSPLLGDETVNSDEAGEIRFELFTVFFRFCGVSVKSRFEVTGEFSKEFSLLFPGGFEGV